MVSVRTVTLFFRMDTPDDYMRGGDEDYFEESEKFVDAEIHAFDSLLLRNVVLYDEKEGVSQRLRLSITSALGF